MSRSLPFSFIFIVLLIVSVIFTMSSYSNKQIIKTKVLDKERITTSDNGQISSYYLIFTDAGPLKLEDELFYGNFNSSDWYGQLHKDSTYTFHTIGFRIGLLSEYPNIIKFKK